jgi:hypothetical protein
MASNRTESLKKAQKNYEEKTGRPLSIRFKSKELKNEFVNFLNNQAIENESKAETIMRLVNFTPTWNNYESE